MGEWARVTYLAWKHPTAEMRVTRSMLCKSELLEARGVGKSALRWIAKSKAEVTSRPVENTDALLRYLIF
jgi:hypothetical protein